MVRGSARIVISVLLIGLGVLILLSNLNLLPFDINAQNWFWVVVFGAAGVGFLSVFLNRPGENWWAVIPSFTFLGLAFIVGDFLPRALDDLNGAVFLGMLGLSFWVIFAVRREQWWAIIPGGVLTTLAGIVVINNFTESGLATGAALFLGLALTFLVVYLRPIEGERAHWAIYPAGILGVLSVLLLLGLSELINLVIPAALIVIGGIVLLRAMRR